MKRQLNGTERIQVEKQLVKRRAAPYRDEQIQKNVKFGQAIPYFIRNTNVLREVETKESLGSPRKSKIDMISAIRSIKYNADFTNCIRFFDIVGFGVSFLTKEQMYTFKEYCRVVKNSHVCLDATGAVVKKFELGPGWKTGSIFLYTLTINFNGTTLPVV